MTVWASSGRLALLLSATLSGKPVGKGSTWFHTADGSLLQMPLSHFAGRARYAVSASDSKADGRAPAPVSLEVSPEEREEHEFSPTVRPAAQGSPRDSTARAPLTNLATPDATGASNDRCESCEAYERDLAIYQQRIEHLSDQVDFDRLISSPRLPFSEAQLERLKNLEPEPCAH